MVVYKNYIFLNRTSGKLVIIKATKFELAEHLLLSKNMRGFELFSIMGETEIMNTITLPGILTEPVDEKSPTLQREALV